MSRGTEKARSAAVTAADRCERFLPLAETHPVGLVGAQAAPEDLWLALLGTLAARRRHLQGKEQLAQLQQRLSDRIPRFVMPKRKVVDLDSANTQQDSQNFLTACLEC